MHVMIRNESKELFVTSVTLATDPRDIDGSEINPFYCFRCQNFIGKFQGRVLGIMPGFSPVQLPFLFTCDNQRRNFETVLNPKGTCGMTYIFQSIL